MERWKVSPKPHRDGWEQGRSKAVLVATSSLAVLSSHLRRLVGSRNSGFVSGLKKPYWAWSHCSERARRFWRPLHLPVPQEGWVIFLILLLSFSCTKEVLSECRYTTGQHVRKEPESIHSATPYDTAWRHHVRSWEWGGCFASKLCTIRYFSAFTYVLIWFYRTPAMGATKFSPQTPGQLPDFQLPS